MNYRTYRYKIRWVARDIDGNVIESVTYCKSANDVKFFWSAFIHDKHEDDLLEIIEEKVIKIDEVSNGKTDIEYKKYS